MKAPVVGQVFVVKASVLAERERLRSHLAGKPGLTKAPKSRLTLKSVDGFRCTAVAGDGTKLEGDWRGLLQDYELAR